MSICLWRCTLGGSRNGLSKGCLSLPGLRIRVNKTAPPRERCVVLVVNGLSKTRMPSIPALGDRLQRHGATGKERRIQFWDASLTRVRSPVVSPEGWPENSPVIGSSMSSYRVLWPCHSRLTPKYRSYASEAAQRKRVFHLRSRRELKQFLEAIKNEVGAARSRAARQAAQPDGPAAG
jgi:hypothetical protein